MKLFAVTFTTALLAIGAPTHGDPEPRALALTGVTIIDLESGALRPNQTVLVQDGRIAALGENLPLPPRTRRVDARGRFLLPGLWDMHVHLSWTTGTALAVLVANGVTGVRDLGSDYPEVLGWRARIAAGDLIGPRIVTSGPMLNGRSFNRYQLATGDSSQARGIVRALKQMGVDLIKVHRRVERDAYFAIADETRKQGLRLVGHIPLTIRPDEASDAGQQIEHTETIWEGTFAAGLSPEALPDSIQRFLAGEGGAALLARFVRNGTPVTPALGAWRYIIDHPDTTWLADPRMRYVPCALKEATRRSPPVSSADLPAIRRNYDAYRATVARMNQSGVTLLAGSDIAGPRLPGFSLHDELAALVDAGLTPLQALRAATVLPSRVLGRDGDVGSVASGRAADLLLLDANPLVDIRNSQRISAVVLAGRYLARGALDSLLRGAAAEAKCR